MMDALPQSVRALGRRGLGDLKTQRGPVPSSPKASARLRRQPSWDTLVELAFRSAVYRRGFRYRVHRRPLADFRRQADLVFPGTRVAVFVDGCFWHGCPAHIGWPKSNADWWRVKIARTRERDADTDARLREAGWTPFRVWEHDDPEAAADRLAALLLERRRLHADHIPTPQQTR